ncbi:MAG: hypothetical protein RBG13Loki_1368 [Promethearchaeota archaeon CR_4]|nr:MAG: hypothetical protein RBG13Loki_1368 [Candidatus Lokiarchaeota archaeon CR_4]
MHKEIIPIITNAVDIPLIKLGVIPEYSIVPNTLLISKTIEDPVIWARKTIAMPKTKSEPPSPQTTPPAIKYLRYGIEAGFKTPQYSSVYPQVTTINLLHKLS